MKTNDRILSLACAVCLEGALGAPTLLWLLARVVLRVEVGDHPRTDIVELNHRLLVYGHEVWGAGRKRDEASCRHRFRLARIRLFAHPDTEGPRDHGEEPGL